jgi:hypothetical protein
MEQLQYCRWLTPFIQRGTDTLDKVFFTDGHDCSLVYTLVAKTAGYGVLKIPVSSINDHYIR